MVNYDSSDKTLLFTSLLAYTYIQARTMPTCFIEDIAIFLLKIYKNYANMHSLFSDAYLPFRSPSRRFPITT